MSAPEGPLTGSASGYAPAYGLVDAVLTYAMFYVIVDQLTPTVTTTLSTTLPDVSPDTVGLGLAVFLWFVLVVTVIDQARRQLAALGIGRHSAVDSDRSNPAVPAKTSFVVYLLAAVFAGVVVVGTVDTAIDTLHATVVIVARPETATFDFWAIALLVLFFVAYGVLTWSVDRFVIGGLRSVLG